MTTRRQFLTSSTLMAGLSVAHAAPADAQAAVEFPELRSRAAEALPITGVEYRSRIERAQKLLAEQRIEALILADGTSLRYFTGVHWWGSERLFAAVVPARGEPFFVCPAFEEGRAREQLGALYTGATADVRTWQEHESPYALLGDGLRARGLATGQLGIEETVRFVFAQGIGAALPHAKLVTATPVTAGCRMIKSSHEVALMRLASQVTVAAYEATWKRLQPGMTPTDITDLSRRAHAALGFAGAADLVLIDGAAAYPHGTTQPTRLEAHSLVLFDGGCSIYGYQSDISRTFVLAAPTARMQSVFDTVHRAQAAALAAARPGAACGAIDAAARGVVEAAGFGAGYAHFTHRVGHGIGMDGHEWPYLVRDNPFALAQGMTTSDEPGIYLPGEFGIRLEDELHVTEEGAELLTPQSPSLEAPFAHV